MILPIYLYGQAVLRKETEEITADYPNLPQLLENMYETLVKSEGVGLAAPQVGILRRVVVVDVEEGYFEFINPKITKQSGEQNGWEGCLSVKGKQGVVSRPMKVTLRFQDRNGNPFVLKAKGFFARAICHELDHLDGVLYIDRASHVEKV
jgi:peptide deformylase